MKTRASSIRALSFYSLYIVHGSLISKEIGLSIRRLPRGCFSQSLLASPDNVSGRNLKHLQFLRSLK